jgi:DNA-binding response OmpR family regulator
MIMAARVLIVEDDPTMAEETGADDYVVKPFSPHPGETFNKEELLRRVWGWEFGDTSTVTVHVRRLREKLEADPSDPAIVLTVGRSGYRLARPDEVDPQ